MIHIDLVEEAQVAYILLTLRLLFGIAAVKGNLLDLKLDIHIHLAVVHQILVDTQDSAAYSMGIVADKVVVVAVAVITVAITELIQLEVEDHLKKIL